MIDFTTDNRFTTLSDLPDADLVRLASTIGLIADRPHFASAVADMLGDEQRDAVVSGLDHEIAEIVRLRCEDCDPDERVDAQVELYRELTRAVRGGAL